MSGPEATPKPVSAEEVARLRSDIRTLLHNAQAESQKTGKPLLILVGEYHGTPVSTFLESLIYTEATRIGINHLSIEQPMHYATDGHDPLSDASLIALYVSQAQFFHHTIHYVDDLHDIAPFLPDNAVEERNVKIAENLSSINASNLMITGANHLSGLSKNNALNASHTLIIFDVSPLYGVRPNLGSAPKAPNYHEFKLQGDAREMDLQSIVTATMESGQANHFMQFLRDIKMVELPREQIGTLSRNDPASDVKGGEFSQTYGLKSASDAAYNLKQYDLAARTAALEQELCSEMSTQKAKHTSCAEDNASNENRNASFRNLFAQYESSMSFSKEAWRWMTREPSAKDEITDVAQKETMQLIAAPAPNGTTAKPSKKLPPH